MPDPLAAPPALRYDQLQRLGRRGAWRPVVGVLAAAASVFGLASVVALVPVLAWYAVAGPSLAVGLERITSIGDPWPSTLAYVLLTLSCAIPVLWLVQRLVHGLPFGWLSSVAGRLRWHYLFACVAAAVAALVATLAVGAVVPGEATGGVGVTLNEFTPRVRDALLVVLVLTPFQAAAEEYLFRGYLMQALGGLATARAVSVVGSALLFALAHGLGQGWPVFIDRLAFGLVAGALVLLTGGLEAAIAMHVLNNWVAFGLAITFGDLATALQPSGGSWWMLLPTLTQSGVYLALAWALARWMGTDTTVRAPVLEPRTRPV